MARPDAIAEYREAQRRRAATPGNATAVFNVGWTASRVGLFEEAIAAYESALAMGISQPEEAMFNLSVIYSDQLGDVATARHWVAQGLQVNHQYYPAVFQAAHLAEQVGDRQAALDGFARAAELRPDEGLPRARQLEASPGASADAGVVAAVEQFAQGGDIDALFALGKHREALGDWQQAWSAMLAANNADAKDQPPWPAEAIRERVLQGPASGLPPLAGSDGPVFIVGMFRTGSTLLEQILAAHPRFSPLGESEFWPRVIARLGGGMVIPGHVPSDKDQGKLRSAFDAMLAARHLPANTLATDKRPDNLFHLATIGRVLPHARFVITQRDWRDTLVSVFGTRLHPQHGYATSVVATDRHLQLCDELAGQWQAASSDRVRLLRYEDLVTRPEQTLRGLLGWLGETWNPACLDFHRLNNPVRTASVWQIREPLSAARLGRWRHFEEPLRSVLGAALDGPG